MMFHKVFCLEIVRCPAEPCENARLFCRELIVAARRMHLQPWHIYFNLLPIYYLFHLSKFQYQAWFCSSNNISCNFIYIANGIIKSMDLSLTTLLPGNKQSIYIVSFLLGVHIHVLLPGHTTKFPVLCPWFRDATFQEISDIKKKLQEKWNGVSWKKIIDQIGGNSLEKRKMYQNSLNKNGNLVHTLVFSQVAGSAVIISELMQPAVTVKFRKFGIVPVIHRWWFISTADLLLKLGRREEAKEIFENLIHRNPENWAYYTGMEKCICAETEEQKLEMYTRYTVEYPKAAAPVRLPLKIATGEKTILILFKGQASL